MFYVYSQYIMYIKINTINSVLVETLRVLKIVSVWIEFAINLLKQWYMCTVFLPVFSMDYLHVENSIF